MNIDVVMYADETGDNGRYNPNTDEIEVNIKGEYSLLQTLSHELVHFMEENKYTYKTLTNKPPINIVKLTTNAPITENGKTDRKRLVNTAIENIIAFGKLNKNGNAVINNYNVGNDIIVSKKSLQHGLDRRVEQQAQVLSHIGEVLQYSIVVNELSPKNDSIDNTYILLGMAGKKDKGVYIVSSLVNSYTNEVEAVDVLYSINTKKESAALLPELQSNDLQSPTDSKISISSFLEIVNEYFPDVLPIDVLKHFGHDKRPSGKLCFYIIL